MSSDIIVIGGGIAGISAAGRMAPQAKVTVIEAEEALGYHASGRSAALFEQSYGKPEVIALNRASAEFHATANGGYLSPRGFMLVCRAGDETAFDADSKAMGCDEISVDAARAMIPILGDAVVRAAYQSEAQDVDTDRLIQDFAKTVRSHGGSVVTGARVTAISRADGQWRVKAGGDTFTAPVLVNAAGAWADQVAGMAGVAPIGITPLRRSMARIPAPGGHDVSGWPMFFGPGETWYAKPDAGQLLVSPAEEHPCEPHDAWADDVVLAEGIDRYQQYVSEPVTRITANWAGLRSFAPDRVLVLGHDPDQPAFVWCAGQGGYGFQTAPAASALVAALTLGHAPELDARLVAALSPKRLR